MGRSPELSVLLPVRDALPFLDEALASLAGQTFENFEVVAVDDGSRDGSAERLAEWARRDRRFRCLTSPGRGHVSALNAGLAACRAPWVARMDADDRCAPERFERQLEALRADPTLDVISCRVRHFPAADVAEGFRSYERWLNALVLHDDILRERFIESPLPHPSVIVRRAAYASVGGYRERSWPEDYDLWLRLARRGARFGKVPTVLLYWRDHAGRLTRSSARYAVERFLACKAHHLLRGPLAAGDRVVVWGAGRTGRRLSKHLLSGGAALAAFVDIDPRKLGRRVRGVAVHPPDALPGLLRAGPRATVLAAVASRGARELIRDRLRGLGLAEGVGFWCVA